MSIPVSAELARDKNNMRAVMRHRRSDFAISCPQAALSVAFHTLATWIASPNAVVAGYRAFRYELDPAPLLAELRRRGHTIVLPRVSDPAEPLQFHVWEPNDKLYRNAMDIEEPDPAAPRLIPDILLVPLLAFDTAHRRLGYGGGYYDRTLKMLASIRPIATIGLAYSCQQVPVVPAGPDDIILDTIMTESGQI